MPRFTKITYSRGMTVNLGDYESVRVDFGAEALLDEGEDYQRAVKVVQDQVDQTLRAEVRRIRRRVEEMGG